MKIKRESEIFLPDSHVTLSAMDSNCNPETDKNNCYYKNPVHWSSPPFLSAGFLTVDLIPTIVIEHRANSNADKNGDNDKSAHSR